MSGHFISAGLSREPACKGLGGEVWEGTGWTTVLLAPSCPSAQHAAHLQALPFWEQNMKMSCHACSPAEIPILSAVVLLHELFVAGRELG